MDGGGRRPLRQQLASFFSEITGPMKAAVALIGAVGTVVGTLAAVGVIGGGSGGSAASVGSIGAGSGGSAAGGAGSRITRMTAADWARRANAICARTNDTRAALPTPRQGLGQQEAVDLIKTASTLQQRLLRELAALPQPTEQQHQIARLLRVGAEINISASELVDDFTLGNFTGAQKRVKELSQLNTDFNATAIDLGATTCAEGGSVADAFAGG
jgi:hypothetical protein